MSLQQKSKQRYPALEDEFVYAIVDAMRHTESLVNELECYRIWNNLVNAVAYLFMNQNIVINEIIRQLIVKLKAEPNMSVTNSRDWLMWFFSQIISYTLIHHNKSNVVIKKVWKEKKKQIERNLTEKSTLSAKTK